MQTLKQFSDRWRKEYLTSLLQRHDNGCVTHPLHHLRPGELVLVKNSSTPKCEWPLGLIEKVFTDASGIIRSVQLRSRGESYLRDVSYVVPLELQCEGEHPNEHEQCAHETPPTPEDVEGTSDSPSPECTQDAPPEVDVEDQEVINPIPEEVHQAELTSPEGEMRTEIPSEGARVRSLKRAAATKQRALMKELVHKGLL